MSDRANAPSARRAVRVALFACDAAAVLAWFLLVLRYQYDVAWLQPHDVGLDAVFLVAIAGVAIARGIDRRGAAAMGRTLLRLMMATIVTVLALVGAEYAARFRYRQARSSGNAGDYIAQRVTGLVYRVNNVGFRDRDVPPKTPDRVRIVVGGDSFTWGQGLEESERFSNLLEQSLGTHYEVFNFGRPGNNMPEHLDVLARALAVSPDFVLLQLYTNDFETSSMVRPSAFPLLPASMDKDLGSASQLYDLFRNQWRRLQEITGVSESYAHFMERNLRDPNAPNAREAIGNLEEFFNRARASKVPAGAVFFPAIDSLGPNGQTYPFGYLHEDVRLVCAEQRVTCVDLLSLFSTFREPRALWVSPFDAHPNAMANRRAASAILEAFASVWHR